MEKMPNLNCGMGPAILFGIVRAVAVTVGATLLRGGLHWGAFAALGIAVAWLAVMIESDLTERLKNPLQPRKSLAILLPAWLVVISVVIGFSALTSFAVLAPQVRQRELDKAAAAFWASEVTKSESWTVNLRTSLTRVTEAQRQELDAEQARVAQARRERVPYTTENVTRLRRQAVATRALADKATGAALLPLDPPKEPAKAQEQLGASHRTLTNLYVASVQLLPELQRPPAPAHHEPPQVDLASLFMQEAEARSTSSVVGFAAAGILELLSFLSIFQGGRRTPFAVRITNWWNNFDTTWKAVLRRHPGISIPVLIKPDLVEGYFYLRVPPTASFAECAPRLRELLNEHSGATGAREWLEVSTSDGSIIDPLEPLMPQLAGKPLVITFAEA